MIPDCEWQDIVDLCDAKRTIGRHRDDKWQSGWLSPAILHSGATSRQITDVVRMAAWFGWRRRPCQLDAGDAAAIPWQLGLCRLLDHPFNRSERRWRFLMPLSRETTVSEFTGVWKALNHPARWRGG